MDDKTLNSSQERGKSHHGADGPVFPAGTQGTHGIRETADGIILGKTQQVSVSSMFHCLTFYRLLPRNVA